MSRPLGPYQERRARQHSDDLRTWPRKREYAYMVIAFILACWISVGTPDFHATLVTEQIEEEARARVAEQVGEVIAARYAGDPRELSLPLHCLGSRTEQWVAQGERAGKAKPTPVCINADLRDRGR